MALPYEVFIGLRYLRARRKEGFISLITFISIAGVALGVTALIVVISVMAGFEEDLRNKIIGTSAHITVVKHGGEPIKDYRQATAETSRVKGVVAATPFVLSQVMVTSSYNVSGIVLRGIDPETESTVTDLERNIKIGSLDLLKKEQDEPGIIIGKELARNLGVLDGDMLTLISPMGSSTPAGMIPRFKNFRVAGIFDSGFFEFDNSLAYISIGQAQRFFNMGDMATGIEVKVDDVYAARSIGRDIQMALGGDYWVRDWMQMNRNLFSAIKLEKITMFVILILIVLVAAFNIVSTLIMIVMEKGREIAILKSMGATRTGIMKIFMIDGLIIGTIGTTIGVAGAAFLCWVLKTYPFISLPSDIYYLSKLPVKMIPANFVITALAAVTISFLATLYPSWKAGRLDPVEALRYE